MDPIALSAPNRISPTSSDLEGASLQTRISALYGLLQASPHVFASPLGPFSYSGRTVWFPRYIFCGPHASDESWRLSFLAGFSRRDLRPSHALLSLLESLVADAENGHGLNLAFFPIVDAVGLQLPGHIRRLEQENWNRSIEPEIALLARDVRTRGYHGFVRIESAHDDLPSVVLRTPAHFVPAGPDVELISSDAFDPLEVRFEREPAAESSGPLDLAEDLGTQPFELTLRIPDAWNTQTYHAAVKHILTRFIHRYRAFQAYGGQL